MFRLAALLMSLGLASASVRGGSKSATAPSDSCPHTVGEIACETPGFETLCSLLQAAGLDGAEVGDKFTIFAPTDDAFSLVPAETLTFLSENIDELQNVLLFHVILGKTYLSTDLTCTGRLEMANGKDSRTVCERGGSVFQKGAGNSRDEMPEITSVDIKFCDGVVHVVDRVLLP